MSYKVGKTWKKHEKTKPRFFLTFPELGPNLQTEAQNERFPKGKPDEASGPPKDCTCQSLRLFDASKILHQLGC